MKRIIIYGLGNEFKKRKDFLEEKFEVVGYSDKKSLKERTIEPENINDYQFDYILITSNKYYEEIKEELIKNYFVEINKIVSIIEIFIRLYNLSKKDEGSTSITDNGIYPSFCLVASQKEDIFFDFRRNPIIEQVYEITSQSLGQDYLEVMNQNSKVTFSEDDWQEFVKNDLYGCPLKYEQYLYGRKQEVSTVTLRYIKVLQDILTLFNIENIKNITEIGVGYGGQCRIILSYLKNRKYSLIDLPEVLKLAKLYIGKYFLDDEVSYVDGTKDVNIEKSDLVMSNYAFSELNRDVQDFYLEKVIDCAASGYITWNFLSYERLGGYSINELLDRISGSFILEEKPLTYRDNCILVWGCKKEIR